MEQRYYWGDFLGELRLSLIRSEDDVRKKMSAQKSGVDVGIWIEQLTPAGGAANLAGASGSAVAPAGMVPGMQRVVERYARMGVPQAAPTPTAPTASAGANTNAITLLCRAVSLKLTVDPSANNKDIAYVVRDEIAASPMVNPDANATQLIGEISPDDDKGTFTFTVSVTPAQPLTF
jgi:hypothetical protein